MKSIPPHEYSSLYRMSLVHNQTFTYNYKYKTIISSVLVCAHDTCSHICVTTSLLTDLSKKKCSFLCLKLKAWEYYNLHLFAKSSL